MLNIESLFTTLYSRATLEGCQAKLTFSNFSETTLEINNNNHVTIELVLPKCNAHWIYFAVRDFRCEKSNLDRNRRIDMQYTKRSKLIKEIVELICMEKQ